MYLKLIAKYILMLILITFQVAFISGLPTWFSDVNFILLVLLLVLGFSDYKKAMFWAMGLGILWDMYSFSFFGIYTISLIVCVYLTNFLLENFLTNRSLYTFLALTVFLTILFEVLIVLLNSSYIFMRGLESSYVYDSYFWSDEGTKIVANLILIFFMFYITSFFSNRFKPMFLFK